MAFPLALQAYGCVSLDFFTQFSSSPLSDPTGPSVVTYSSANGDDTNPDTACVAQCAGYFHLGYRFESTSPTDSTLSCACFGAGAFPDPPDYVEATSDIPVCISDSAAFYLQFALFEVDRFPTCYATPDLSTYIDVRSQIGCLAKCYNSEYTKYAYIVPDPIEDQKFKCKCANEPLTDSPLTPAQKCQRGSAFVYRYVNPNPPPVEPSTPVKRRLAEREKEDRRRKVREERWCPRGSTACVVYGSINAYECIETQNELESCGGCVNGYYGQPGQPANGTDCTRLNGILPHSVSCLEGKCEVTSCQEGYLIEDGRCVSRLGSSDFRA